MTGNSPNIIMSAASSCSHTGDTLSISGAQQLALGATASSTDDASVLNISIGYYRLIGVVYTDSSNNLVQFKQHGDTFYLSTPVADINDSTLGHSVKSYPLSVPKGVSVEAFGRCVANNEVHIFDPPLTPGIPAAYPSVPGYDTSTTTSPDTAFPFRSYTDQSAEISARAAGASTTLQCMTDGWVWPRSP